MLAGDEQQWLDRLAAVFQPRLPPPPPGLGLVAYTYDASRPDRVAIRATSMLGYDPALAEPVRSRIAMPDSEQAYLATIFRTGFVGTLRQSPDALRRAGLAEARVQDFERRLEAACRQLNVRDQFWINACQG